MSLVIVETPYLVLVYYHLALDLLVNDSDHPSLVCTV